MPTYSQKQLLKMAENIAFDCVASHSKGAPKFLRLCARQAKRILDESKATHAGKTTPCKKHSGYMGKRRPINGCLDCLKYYNQVQYG